ncbi:trehalose-phosphatase [Candidatus Oleimmundimicrobium sp.]|uniref:trehalose-phosphatase n=1 Tax=Candidatus Oleimmundimicrobium sp. TaxID=3060597 RepID=UPI00271F8245|nr:trehalose-phosphatase [Candidatus Oleimmundimicrobium sp.]MDO8886540.1 trehalose-phosphatase [Candidatus Oleimmundimicrobium sp.]
MRYLFEDWSYLSQTFETARRIFLMADFDGTLAPIVDLPRLAKMSDNMKRLISNLAKSPHFTVGVLSGRALTDLKEKVGIEGLVYAGNHGMEIETASETYIHPEALDILKSIGKVREKLTKSLSSFEGVLIEDKGLTLSIHYRLVASKDVPEVKKIFCKTIEPYMKKHIFKQTEGKKVFELRPPIDWDKGSAILWLIETLNLKNDLPIYLGDDKTDEDAFGVLKEKGISIFVGEPKTQSKAAYYLKDAFEVKIFLKKLGALFNI